MEFSGQKRDFSALSVEEVQKVDNNIKTSHGTAVASIVAYKKPHVKLVLVQKDFGDSSGASELNSDLNEKVSYLNEALVSEDVWDFVAKQTNSEAQVIHDLAIKHHVKLINKSYGIVAPYENIREKYGAVGYPDIANYIILKYKLVKAQVENMGLSDKSLPYLVLQSSGNEGSKIDSLDDTSECEDGEDNRMSVGAFDSYGKVASFSNYGDCVDFYLLGSKVIAATPGGVLYPLDGTSFSSPLGARYISTSYKSNNVQEIKRLIKSKVDKNKFIKTSSEHMKKISYEYGAGKVLELFSDKSSDKSSDKVNKKIEDMRAQHQLNILLNSMPYRLLK